MKYLKFLSPFEKLNLLIYTILITALHFKGGIQRILPNAGDIGLVLLGAVSIIMLLRPLLIFFTKLPRVQTIVAFFFTISHLLLGLFHLRTHTGFDFSIIGDNISLLFYKESATVILGTFFLSDYIIWGLSTLTIIILMYTLKFSASIRSKYKLIQLCILIPLYFMVIFKSRFSYDEPTSFLKTINSYLSQSKTIQNIPKEKFPYRKKFISHYPSKRPHIFVITVESFSARFAYSRSKNGLEYTPLFNKLSRQGWKVPLFYGNSVQTAKGQLAIYCSMIPITRKKVFKHYERLRVRCLPHVLKEAGYTNFFFKAYSKIYFDNTGRFAKQMGFDHIHAMDKTFITAEEKKKFTLGWGIQDKVFYKHFFNYLDKTYKEQGKNLKIFAALTTVTNHAPFKIPQDKRIIYHNPKNSAEHYANSIRLSDQYLETFFRELNKRAYLKNSIVIITGDHSFPLGEHGNNSPVRGFYQESFRTPILFWGKTIEPKLLNSQAFSQIDIAPTIIDYLGISTEAPFIGESIFNSSKRHIPLIQPYDGTYLGVVIHPYKFVFHKKTQKEFCFNLIDDPQENKNIIKTMKESPLYEAFRNRINDIFLNDYLIKKNRIWSSM